MTTLARVLETIEDYPDGVTSSQLALMLDAPSYNVASCASRLWAQNKIGRKAVAGINRAVYAWLPKRDR